jgi:hypothetical protein
LLHRLIRSVAALLSMLAIGAPGTAGAQQAARIVAVGDLHGDFDAWIAIARAARLIDAGNRWSGGAATLVQLGDVTDRGPDSLKIVRSLQQLQREAPASGGRVVVLLGNHEAMNLLGDLRYVAPGEFAAFVDNRSHARRERLYMASRQELEATAKALNSDIRPSQVRAEWLARTPLGWTEHRAAWKPAGELGRWAVANPALVKIGTTLFAHGGLSAEYARIGIDEINRRAQVAMLAVDDRPDSILNDQLGPLWYRGLVTRDPRQDPDGAATAAARPRPPLEEELTAVLAATGTRRIVVGHTPSRSGVIVSNSGRLIRADSGISRYYGGQLAYVEIVGERVTAHTLARPPQGTAQ